MPRISLLLADVDGTLLTEDKILTLRAQSAAAALKARGIRFAITSGRPPRGMAMLIEPLALKSPIAGFNGGVLAQPDLSVIETRTLAPDVAREAIDMIQRRGMDA
jgi:HAD superfamily hydrolase (TIGR01484 family)